MSGASGLRPHGHDSAGGGGTLSAPVVNSTEIVEGAAPASPASGRQRLFIDTADHHLKRKNSAGSVTDLETGGGGSLTLDDGTTTVASVTELDVARIDDLTGGVVAVLPEITGRGDGNLNFAATETKLVSPSTESDLRLQDGGNAILEAAHPSNATPGDFIGVAFTVGPTPLQMNWAEVDSGHLGAWGQGVHVVFYDQFGNTFLFADGAGTFSRPSVGRLRQYASAPSSPSEGDSYYNTTDHTEYFWNGTAWTGPTGASFATPSVALGSSAAAGAAGTVIRSDSTIAAFDATSPTTQAIGDSAVVGTAAFAARRDHKHALTNPLTTQDDLWVGGASGAPSRLAKGTDSQVLTVDPTTHHLVWATNPAGFADPMTSRGDIIVRNASNTTARLAKGSADTYLGSDGTDVSYSAVTDAKLSTSDVTTNNVSTSKHGFAPKAPNDATKYLDGTGAYTVPAGGGGMTQAYAGYNTAGASTDTPGVNSKVYAKSITLANACLITSIGGYVEHAAGFAFGPAVALFTDSAGAPDQVIAYGAQQTITLTTATARWIDVALGAWVAAGTYWLAMRTSDVGGSVVLKLHYDGSGTDRTATTSQQWSDWGSMTSPSTTANKFSIRANTIR